MVCHTNYKTVKAFSTGSGTLGHPRKENPREGWLVWLEKIIAPETGNGNKSKRIYKIKERNWKPLQFQVCIIHRLNHGNWNDKEIYQVPGTINSSFQDIDGTAWK